MPLPGGATDKFGNRYKGRWTVVCMADVLDERANAIRLEPPGIEGEGIEFWLQKSGTREFHQVKCQRSASGRWTLADLAAQGVLQHFWEKLSNTTGHCVFVSTHAAYELGELADRTRSAASWEEFQQAFLRAESQSTSFEVLCRHWGECSPHN